VPLPSSGAICFFVAAQHMRASCRRGTQVTGSIATGHPRAVVSTCKRTRGVSTDERSITTTGDTSVAEKKEAPRGLLATIVITAGVFALGAYTLDLHAHTCVNCGHKWRHLGAFNLGDEESHTCSRCGQVQWWKCGTLHVLGGSPPPAERPPNPVYGRRPPSPPYARAGYECEMYEQQPSREHAEPPYRAYAPSYEEPPPPPYQAYTQSHEEPPPYRVNARPSPSRAHDRTPPPSRTRTPPRLTREGPYPSRAPAALMPGTGDWEECQGV